MNKTECSARKLRKPMAKTLSEKDRSVQPLDTRVKRSTSSPSLLLRSLLFILCSLLALFFFPGAARTVEKPKWTESTPVYQVLRYLGEPQAKHELHINPQTVRMGREIVHQGYTTDARGKRTRYVSKYYVCTSCHNIEREDPDLRVSDPETRLPYVKEKGIPFLQGTTFRGIVNRETWYNDDYVKKYGKEAIGKAHEDLREAIQLCAIQCSQGRYMAPWEIDAVLAYFWTLQWTLGDLELSAEDYQKLEQEAGQKASHKALRQWLKTFYLQKSPAHFFDAPYDKRKGYEGLKGRPAAGKDIYELSCLYCHKDGGVSHYILDNSKLSFKHLKSKIEKDSHMSLYQIIPYGTYAIPGHKPYMPHYPLERMSKQQVEDLRAYVERMAK